MNYNDEQFEEKLKLYKEALTPSRDTARRVMSKILDYKEQPHNGRSAQLVKYSIGSYINLMSKTLKIWLPVGAFAVLLVAFGVFNGSPSGNVAAVDPDSAVNAMVTDELAEQSYLEEDESSLAQGDGAQLDLLASMYNKDEY